MNLTRLVGAGVLAALTWCAAANAESLTVVSWGGSYARACVKGYHEAFTEETGIEVRLEDYNGGLAQLRAQVDAGAVHWDVIDMELADAMTGCDEGLLEVLDLELPPGANGESPEDDFYPEAMGECGIGTLFYSTVYAYRTDHFKERKPETIADFFDLEAFPGRRGMRRVPLVNLEFALMADGVPRDEVYATLDTPEGVSRAFRKLDTIKDQVVWWEAGAQPPQMLADGEVVMTTAYNGRIFNAQILGEDNRLLSSGTAKCWTRASSSSRRVRRIWRPRASSSPLRRGHRPWPAWAATSPMRQRVARAWT